MQQAQATTVQIEPARKLYVLGNGWTSWRATQIKLATLAQNGLEQWQSYAQNLIQVSHKTGCFLVGWVYLAILFCFVMGIFSYITMMLVALLFILLWTPILASGAALCLATIVVFRFCNWLHTTIWHISYDCPNPYCYERKPLPIFKCSHCSAEHQRLRPNVYGILRHRCQCGTQLYTIERFGRHNLARICSACHNPLNHGIGQGTALHFPLIGGPSSGKTHYITAALDALMQQYTSAYHYRFSFPDQLQEANFQANVRNLTQGRTLTVTPEIAPPAYTLKVEVPGIPVPKIMYIYDAAGEAYNTNERTNLQSYYRYIHGLIFIIDPCAISAFRLRYEQQISDISSYLRPCESEIMQVYDRMVRMLEKKRGLHRHYPFPIAVIVTKVDALNLEQEIGASAAARLMSHDPIYTSEGDAINKLVRDFLCAYGLSNLVRNLEYQFSHVRYFSCSALGRLPTQTNTNSFVPIRTLDPLIWLLSQAGVIRQAHKQPIETY
jgi:Double-GTPase 2